MNCSLFDSTHPSRRDTQGVRLINFSRLLIQVFDDACTLMEPRGTDACEAAMPQSGLWASRWPNGCSGTQSRYTRRPQHPPSAEFFVLSFPPGPLCHETSR